MNAAVSPSAAAPAVPAAPVSLSPTRRAWRRFARNRLGYWSLLLFCVLVVLSLGAELISNDRPLVVRYAGQTYWPLWKDYPETTFGGDFLTPTDYLDPFIQERLARPGNWALHAPNPYGPKTLNYFAKAPNPSAPSRDNWLGTDDRGRDLLAQLFAHSIHPHNIYRHSWQPHDLVFWDNRSLIHLAAGCPSHLRRKLFRTTIQGDAPF